MVPKWCVATIHDHGIDLFVTMVGWVDVPDSDKGDFKRRCAVDIPSFTQDWTSNQISPSYLPKEFMYWLER